MSGYANIPQPRNEPVLAYAPGSLRTERTGELQYLWRLMERE